MGAVAVAYANYIWEAARMDSFIKHQLGKDDLPRLAAAAIEILGRSIPLSPHNDGAYSGLNAAQPFRRSKVVSRKTADFMAFSVEQAVTVFIAFQAQGRADLQGSKMTMDGVSSIFPAREAKVDFT